MILLAFIIETELHDFNLILAWDTGDDICSEYLPTLEAAQARAREMGLRDDHIVFC